MNPTPTFSSLPASAGSASNVPRPYYDHGGVTIYNGDCRQIVPLLGNFDLLLTDPPYGLGDKWSGGNFKGKNGHGKLWGGKCPDWDKTPVPNWLMEQCINSATTAIVWGGNYYPMPPSRGWLMWDKVQEWSGSDGELAWSNKDMPLKVFRMSRGEAHGSMAGKSHPTQKPLALMQWCISLAGDVETILDPFAGSGTTGEAAKLLGKRAVLIEREERYCEIAAKRLAQEILAL